MNRKTLEDRQGRMPSDVALRGLLALSDRIEEADGTPIPISTETAQVIRALLSRYGSGQPAASAEQGFPNRAGLVTFHSLLRALQNAHVRVSGSSADGWKVVLPVAQEPTAWEPSDADVQAWAERHLVENTLKGSAARCAIDDARSLHMIAAPVAAQAQPVSGAGSEWDRLIRQHAESPLPRLTGKAGELIDAEIQRVRRTDGMRQELMALSRDISKNGKGGEGAFYWNYAIAVLERFGSVRPCGEDGISWDVK